MPDLRNTWAKRADVCQASNGWSRRATGMSIFFGKQLKAKPAMRSAHFPCGTGILFDPTFQVLLRKSQREVYHILKSPACTCFWITFSRTISLPLRTEV